MLLTNVVVQDGKQDCAPPNKHKVETNRSHMETHTVNLIGNPWKALCYWSIILLFHNTSDNLFTIYFSDNLLLLLSALGSLQCVAGSERARSQSRSAS